MKNIFHSLIRSVPLSIVLISLAYLIVHLILKEPQKLDFTLFVLGGLPIVIFLPSVFSQSRAGALHTPKVIFRKVDTLKKTQLKEKDVIFPALSYVLAGILTWIYSSIIY